MSIVLFETALLPLRDHTCLQVCGLTSKETLLCSEGC